jgi:hypothetical protein
MKDRQSAEITWRLYARLVANVLDGHGNDYSPTAWKTVLR